MDKKEIYSMIDEIHIAKSHLQHVEYKLNKMLKEMIYNEHK